MSKTQNTAIVLRAECDWEMLYVNGLLVDEGHTLNEGTPACIYYGRIAQEHNFNLIDIQTAWLTAESEEWLEDYGHAPKKLEELQYKIESH